MSDSGSILITGGSGTSSGCGGSITITGGYGILGATFMFGSPLLAYSGALILKGLAKSTVDALVGIQCKCETRMLMRRGCNCGAMKAELSR